jgi:guanyl-specific ribonuclease Sa
VLIQFFCGFSRANEQSISNNTKRTTVKIQNMKTKKVFTIAAVSVGLAFGVTTQANEKHQGQTVNSSDVPTAVQSAAQAQAQGGTIIRWEKEGANFGAVIDKNGRQIGLEMDANGKVLSKRNEARQGAKY